jgi:hypothetical protein
MNSNDVYRLARCGWVLMMMQNLFPPITVLVVLASIPSFASAQTAQQFDLICTGAKTTMSNTTPFRGVQEPFHREWIIDLNRKAFCEITCSTVRKIANATDTDIVLWDNDEQQFTDKGTFVKSTGEFESLKQQKGAIYSEMVVAKCTQEPFKGFPAH